MGYGPISSNSHVAETNGTRFPWDPNPVSSWSCRWGRGRDGGAVQHRGHLMQTDPYFFTPGMCSDTLTHPCHPAWLHIEAQS